MQSLTKNLGDRSAQHPSPGKGKRPRRGEFHWSSRLICLASAKRQPERHGFSTRIDQGDASLSRLPLQGVRTLVDAREIELLRRQLHRQVAVQFSQLVISHQGQSRNGRIVRSLADPERNRGDSVEQVSDKDGPLRVGGNLQFGRILRQGDGLTVDSDGRELEICRFPRAIRHRDSRVSRDTRFDQRKVDGEHARTRVFQDPTKPRLVHYAALPVGTVLQWTLYLMSLYDLHRSLDRYRRDNAGRHDRIVVQAPAGKDLFSDNRLVRKDSNVSCGSETQVGEYLR